MTKDVVYLLPKRSPETSFSTTEVLRLCQVNSEWLQLLRRHQLLTTVLPREKYRQEDVDQVHNVLILKHLFHIVPESLWSLYYAFNEHVASLPLKDTDLFRYGNQELSDAPQASAEILILTLKKVFRYMAALTKGGHFVKGHKRRVIRVKDA